MTIFWSALLSLVLVGVFIQLAKRFGWGKAIRESGPQSHLAKAGTPTMGGAAFLLAAFLVWLLLGEKSSDGWALFALTLGAALFGWYDDLMALNRKRQQQRGYDASTGALARYRLLLQGLVALAFASYAVNAGHGVLGSSWLDVPFFTLVVVGTINAVNFTDGLDGLAAGTVALLLLPFLAFGFAGALLGALLGFLWFNAQPARVIMGGVGAEALGAAVAGLAILSGWVWWLPLIALVPVLEVVSVIVQVVYFRATGGKRLLKMSPLHHHFELSGWPESRITLRFWLITAALVAVAWHYAGGRV
jgi:phospho-N-acetylmuramoyl-pentapeptide-transferase